jgi:Rrf2 family protein
MISQTAEYALRAVVCLAQNPDKPLTSSEIAKLTKVPEHYLSKVLKELAKGKIVRSKRGLHGGFDLAHSPDELALLDVIDVVDPIKKIISCPLKLESHGTNLCPLHKKINNSIAHMQDTFREATISTILAEPTMSTPLCESWEK